MIGYENEGMSNRMYLQIVVYLPVDEPAHQAFENLGCPPLGGESYTKKSLL
ncbi:hypothetical protein SAMN04487969_10785 [Paenibacillus algorifonticola]|uniref:Uncharacterized protein n=1 Tax=Paenibacillus algorifonticola TaxID=684063 RepID=A0A1I2DM14_9BACL|nr:hypothetical protein SAMN04487969_10785 [Paenibacillus algorifonticola]